MSRFVNVDFDYTVRLELPDDHPYFTKGRSGTEPDNEDFIEAEADVIHEASRILGTLITGSDRRVIFSDASATDVTEMVA